MAQIPYSDVGPPFLLECRVSEGVTVSKMKSAMANLNPAEKMRALVSPPETGAPKPIRVYFIKEGRFVDATLSLQRLKASPTGGWSQFCKNDVPYIISEQMLMFDCLNHRFSSAPGHPGTQ